MAEIISIRFKREGKQYYFDPVGLQVSPGEGVIVETSWGIEYGECVRGNSQVPDEELVAPLRQVIRVATEQDMEMVKKNREREEQAFRLCQEKIQLHSLDMKLVEVEYSFDGSKLLFFFTSDGRVDFRGLVKDLAAAFHTRIELRQIGVRDEARMLGGLGICGREFCCASFLKEFQPVSIKMAKTQSLSLNPAKISGACGRLMCCLNYEQHAYEDLLRTSPKADSFVETPDGVGDIVSVNTLREKVRVRLDNMPDSLKVYHNDEIRVVRSGKGKRPDGYMPTSLAVLAALRRTPAQEEIGTVGNPTELQRLLDKPAPAAHKQPLFEGEQRQSHTRNDRRRNDKRKDAKAGESVLPQQKIKPMPEEAKEELSVAGMQNREGKRSNHRMKPRSGRPNEKGHGQERPQKKAQTEELVLQDKPTVQPMADKTSKHPRRKWRPRRPTGNKKPPQGEEH